MDEDAEGPGEGRRSWRSLRDFLVHGTFSALLLVVLVQAISRVGIWMGPLVPLAWENEVGARLAKTLAKEDHRNAEAEARRQTLQRLADKLATAEQLPEGMRITVHYASNPDVANAGATFGGHIIVYEGLLAYLPSENSLSMVLGHEIGHVKHRDVVRGASGNILIGLIVDLATTSLLSIAANDSFRNGLVTINVLTRLQLGREFETRADVDGLRGVYGVYGHVNGSIQAFDILESLTRDKKPLPNFLSDHPETAWRKQRLREVAKENGWPLEGPLTPLRQANFRSR